MTACVEVTVEAVERPAAGGRSSCLAGWPPPEPPPVPAEPAAPPVAHPTPYYVLWQV